MGKADIGIYGLGVMGSNLALNFEQNGFRVAVYNRTVPGREEGVVSSFMDTHGNGKKFVAAGSIEEFIGSLTSPRRILLMIKAGKAVDQVLERLTPLIDEGDIVIDGGNSHFKDTQRRFDSMQARNFRYLGMGISGGEEGARKGPSLMPGGDREAWQKSRTHLEAIAAKDPGGSPCCGWIGEGGAGHFVKMVHNGIEYADMQLIAEAYHIMKSGLAMKAPEIAAVFEEWNSGMLGSYLLEITARILKVEEGDGTPLVDHILDAAGQKGTGRWSAASALETGSPLPVITGAVYARMFSGLKALRVSLAGNTGRPHSSFAGERDRVLVELPKALLASRIIVLGEGFFHMQQTADEWSWDIDRAEVARIWQSGCIIRSKLLKPVRTAFLDNAGIEHLLADDHLSGLLSETTYALRNTLSMAVQNGIPCPAMSNALAQFDMLQSEWLPANLIQGQRDYFGAHGYERVDRPRGTFFHTDWNQ